MAYATVADLDRWLGRPAPANAQRLLERASTTVAHGIRAHIGDNGAGQPATHGDTIRDAVCAQVEFWLSTSEQVDVTPQRQANKSGELQTNSEPPLAPRADRILSVAGLRNPTV